VPTDAVFVCFLAKTRAEMSKDMEERGKRLRLAEYGLFGLSCDLTRIHIGAIIVKRF
jgi:hypothetical protein